MDEEKKIHFEAVPYFECKICLTEIEPAEWSVMNPRGDYAHLECVLRVGQVGATEKFYRALPD